MKVCHFQIDRRCINNKYIIVTVEFKFACKLYFKGFLIANKTPSIAEAALKRFDIPNPGTLKYSISYKTFYREIRIKCS
jgi:hypothetical protein